MAWCMTQRVDMKTLICWLLLLGIVCLPVAHRAMGAETGCVSSADNWIHQLKDVDYELLERHARSNCAFACSYVRDNTRLESENQKELICKDLVLIWTHQKCVYFREYVSPKTYDPCKEWSREMYRQCKQGQSDWFP